MKTEHTPGPWKHDGDDGAGVVIVTSKWGSVARVMRIGSVIQERANARLIAAAPELLATLEVLAVAANEAHDMDPALDRAIASALLAIDKAKGQP